MFQYQKSTRIGHIIGFIGSIMTFVYALKVIVSTLLRKRKEENFNVPHRWKDIDLNTKMIFLCFLSSLGNFFLHIINCYYLKTIKKKKKSLIFF